MIERPLMTPDELKSMPKGQFVVMKTGFYPMKVRLKLFFKWEIRLKKEYVVEENANRKVAYAEKKDLIDGIIEKYHPEWLMEEDMPPNAMPVGSQTQVESEKNQAISKSRLESTKSKKSGGGALRTSPRSLRGENHVPEESLIVGISKEEGVKANEQI